MFIMHVDDFIWSGKDSFEERVIEKICSAFCCGKKTDDSFRYIGLNIEHSDDSLILRQQDYINEIHALLVTFLCQTRDTEQTLLRELLGQFNWLANQSRRDITCDVLELSMSVKNATIAQIKQLNKLVKRVNGGDITIKCPCLGRPNEMRILLFSDVAYANLIDGVSSAEGVVHLLGAPRTFDVL